ncbi:hypothetical protein [Desertibacillus haloalkaliphilus]|uniref:hypothetical protein n=1 Tax=Desertibacillus haloalkaliphilus TaxID=1328930 RepID=UPI001C25EF75|nr:hypothetical protein [Desertibacillus haloalkaliphilus]MBU8908883.1 hypothetical protein [Desertibacillus haloalkaliphilus]
MKQLTPCYLGKTVTLHNANSKSYVIQYQENDGQDCSVLLFAKDQPEIFAVIGKDGTFKRSFFIKDHYTKQVTDVLSRYEQIQAQRKARPLTQDDIKDASNSSENAKMKNEHLVKLLTDEHLQDISNLWPSRLLMMQQNENKSNRSLLLQTLKKALAESNPQKAFHYLTFHRYDDYLPYIHEKLTDHPKLLTEIIDFYLDYDQINYLEPLLQSIAKNIDLEKFASIQHILIEMKKLNKATDEDWFKKVFTVLYRRARNNYERKGIDWLNHLVKDDHHPESVKLKVKIVQLLKQQ